MPNFSVTLVLAGAYAGATRVLNGHQFVDGKLTLEGDPLSLAGPIRYLGRAYEAYPENSKELAEAQARFDNHGDDNGDADAVSQTPESGSSETVQGDADSSGEGSPETGESDELGADDGDQGTDSVGPDGAERDGHEHAGNDSVKGQTVSKLAEAVYSLNPDTDGHWTAQGLPAMAEVEKVYGESGITRRDVNEAAPGYDRDAARERGLANL